MAFLDLTVFPSRTYVFISNSHNIQFDMYSKFLNRFSKFINGELSTILSTITVTDC